MYSGLATIYDFLTAGVDFEGWIDYLEEILARTGYTPYTVADLACGTGNATLTLARRGYQVFGVDLSGEMLRVAREKAKNQGLAVDFLVQDMRSFQLPRPVHLITCFHDGLNYLLEYNDLKQTFCRVYASLVPGGMFVFDLNAIFWLARVPPGVNCFDEENLTLIWESHFADPIWEIRLTAFIKERDCCREVVEVHRERGYRPEEVESALKEAGMELLAAYDAFSFEPVCPDSRRHFYVARRSSKL